MAIFKREPAATWRASELEIAEVAAEGWRRLQLRGELDMASVPLLLDALAEARPEDGAGGVELDMSEVSFIDSTGVRALISIDALCREAGRAWRIARAPRQVRRVLMIAGVFDRLPVEAGEDALA